MNTFMKTWFQIQATLHFVDYNLLLFNHFFNSPWECEKKKKNFRRYVHWQTISFMHLFLFHWGILLSIYHVSSKVLCSGGLLISNYSSCMHGYSKKKKWDSQTADFMKPAALFIKYTHSILCYEILMDTYYLFKILMCNWLSVSILMQALKEKKF